MNTAEWEKKKSWQWFMHLGLLWMRREGKQVQSFFFLVNEHVSPAAGEGEVKG